jgi:uracil-DNA glycosylase
MSNEISSEIPEPSNEQFSLFDLTPSSDHHSAEKIENPKKAKQPKKGSVTSSIDPAPTDVDPATFDPALIPTSKKIPIPVGTYQSMGEMQAHCGECQRCELGATRTHPVVSRGNPQASILIIGEGPGENEDLQGKPFVGKSGQLLDKILASVNLTEEDVFICNIVKCRPPGNRKPSKDEMDACRPYLLEQIRLVNPKIILMTGASAIEGLFQEKSVGITKIRGEWREWEGRACMPIFHPSYLLRNQSREKGSPKWLTWQDIQEVRRKFDALQAEEVNTEEVNTGEINTGEINTEEIQAEDIF